MGWYTYGSGGLGYKYGDVVKLAQASGLGQLEIVPRVLAADEHGEPIEVDDLEFLGTLQKTIERLGLPWQHVDFEPGGGGEAIRVDLDTDPDEELDRVVDLAAAHAGSIVAAYRAASYPCEVAELMAAIDWSWSLPGSDVPTFIDWLNQPLDDAPISLERLREGRIEGNWYQPPAMLVDAFDRFGKVDHSRHLAAHALACAVLAGEDLYLDQPYDNERPAWRRGDQVEDASADAVLFRPADQPLLALLARAFGVPRAVQECVFYLYPRGERRVALPPEGHSSPEDVRAGMAFAG